MGKVERLIAIVMILLQKERVSASEFAQLFNVTKRTILRDMEALSMANIPIYAMNGVNGGYGIMEEYKLDKRLLTSGDLANIMTALSGLGQILFSEEVEVTIRKIASMASHAAPQGAIQWSFYQWDGRAEMAQLLRTCQEAIAQSRLIAFDYMDKDGVRTHRIVEPYQLRFSEMSWYMRGFCLDRMDYRTFKLSRSERLRLEPKTFVPREGAGKDAESNGRPQPPLVTVRALIAPVIKDHFIERFGHGSVEPYHADRLIATMRLPQNHYGYQFLAGFGVHVRIIEPAAYVEEFRRFLHNAAAQYADDGLEG